MMRRRPGPIEPPDPPDPFGPCNSCHSTAEPRDVATIYGMAVILCVNPAACRTRAERAGIWGTAN